MNIDTVFNDNIETTTSTNSLATSAAGYRSKRHKTRFDMRQRNCKKIKYTTSRHTTDSIDSEKDPNKIIEDIVAKSAYSLCTSCSASMATTLPTPHYNKTATGLCLVCQQKMWTKMCTRDCCKYDAMKSTTTTTNNAFNNIIQQNILKATSTATFKENKATLEQVSPCRELQQTSQKYRSIDAAEMTSLSQQQQLLLQKHHQKHHQQCIQACQKSTNCSSLSDPYDQLKRKHQQQQRQQNAEAKANIIGQLLRILLLQYLFHALMAISSSSIKRISKYEFHFTERLKKLNSNVTVTRTPHKMTSKSFTFTLNLLLVSAIMFLILPQISIAQTNLNFQSKVEQFITESEQTKISEPSVQKDSPMSLSSTLASAKANKSNGGVRLQRNETGKIYFVIFLWFTIYTNILA